MRVICDESKCVGCLACVVACLDHHYDVTDVDAVAPRLHRMETRPSGLEQYATDSCRHCANAACMAVCPAKALSRDEHGFVVVDRDACVGCGACARACPYHIPRVDGAKKMVKCDGCGGRAPACVTVCPLKALRLGE